MGFLQAMWALGGVEGGKGLSLFLSYPWKGRGELSGFILRLRIPCCPFKCPGVRKGRFRDFQPEPEMKLKYLFRNRVGSAAPWGFP